MVGLKDAAWRLVLGRAPCFHCVVVAAIACLVCSGCTTDRRVPVQGQVTVSGQPVDSGTISFEPIDGRGPTEGGSIERGQYRIARVTPGRKIVRIVAVRKTGRCVKPGPPFGADETVEEVEPVRCKPQPADVIAGRENLLSFDLQP